MGFLDREYAWALQSQVKVLEVQLKAVQDAIRKHRDQKGDDRCWRDDEELYKVLPEGYEPPVRDTTVELEHCKQYINCRHNPGTWYISPERRIEELQVENDRLRQMISDKEKRAEEIREWINQVW